MGETFSLQRTRPGLVGISGDHSLNIRCYFCCGDVLFANNGRFSIFSYSVMIPLIVLLLFTTFLWNKVIIKHRKLLS